MPPSRSRRRSSRRSSRRTRIVKGTPPNSVARGDSSGDAGQPKKDAATGKKLGRCTLIERIGRGNTAIVYRAHYEPLDQEVAVKILLPSISSNETLVDRFLTEARTIAKIDNENVVKIYDVGEEDGNYFMVMELLEGEETMDLIRREGMVDVTDSLRIVRQAARGLAAAHGKGLIHRDIKPQNLYLKDDGTVKVVDFGLAGNVDGDTERVGTPHYMAPEVCETGKAELASDVYALGICLHHLLTGQPPFAGMRLQEILRAHMNAPPIRPEATRPTLTKDICELVRELTKRDPLLRPSAAEVVTKLDEIGGNALKDKGTLVRRRSGGALRAARRKKSSATPIIAGAVVLGLAGLFFAFSGDDSKGSSKTKKEDTSGASASDPSSGSPGGMSDAEALAAARAKKKAEEAAYQKRQEAEAKVAFEETEDEVRKLWKTEDDNKDVITRYRFVADRYKGTEYGKKAKKRARAIRKGEVHPHPDKTYASDTEVKSAQQAWSDAKPKIDTAIAAHNYMGARKLVPASVNDATGALAREIEFWATHCDRLAAWKSFVMTSLAKRAKAGALAFTVKGDTLTLKSLTPKAVNALHDGDKVTLAWADVPASEWEQLASHVPDADVFKNKLLRYAFCFSHDLEEPFSNHYLELSLASEYKDHKAEIEDYAKRYENK